MTYNQAQSRAKELMADHPDAHPVRTVGYGWCVQWKRKADNGHDWNDPVPVPVKGANLWKP